MTVPVTPPAPRPDHGHPGGGVGGERALIEGFAAEVTRRLAAAPSAVTPDEMVRRVLDEYARTELAAGRPPPDPATDTRITHGVLQALAGLGGLGDLLDDPDVENINVNGCDNVWVRYADGRRHQVAPVAASDDDLVHLVRGLAARTGVEERRFDRACPRLSLQLPDGSRLFAVMALTERPAISIRRHRLMRVTLGDLQRSGTVDARLAAFLTACVRARKSILIVGGAAVGKTTFLRALAAAIPRHERLITIEDAFELGLDRDPRTHPDVVALQAREANVEGAGAVDAAELVRWALRMSPDRIIVGECRGAEVVPMLNAMSTGCAGSLATIHAPSSRDAFVRLAAYAAQATERLPFDATGLLVAAAVDFVVHLDYTPTGQRVVSSVREIVDYLDGQITSNEVFQPGPDRRAIVRSGALREATLDDLTAAGLDPTVLYRPSLGGG